MKINSINNIHSTALINQNRSNQVCFRSMNIAPVVDVFERSPALIEKTALSKLKKVNFAEYNLLTKVEKDVLRNSLKNLLNFDTMKKDLGLHQYASECIKQALDQEYGADNYVVVTIGRSLSSIGKFLSFKIGEDNVKNIPLSNLSNSSILGMSPSEKFMATADLKSYKEFLESVGLSKEDVESSNKNFVILDYACTANSIKNAYKILTSDCFLGNKKKNITLSTIQDFLPIDNYRQEKANLLASLMYGAYKTYSFVNRLHNIDKDTILDAIDINSPSQIEEKRYLKKLFAFYMLDSFYGKQSPLQKFVIKPNEEKPFIDQDKQSWISPNKQFNKDIFIDSYELDKAILRTEDNSFKEQIKQLKKELNCSTPENYYSSLRSKIKEILDKSF